MNTQDRIAYPIDEGFALVGVARTRGYRAIADGALKTFMLGRRRMVSRRALEDFIKTAEASAELLVRSDARPSVVRSANPRIARHLSQSQHGDGLPNYGDRS